ncbi:sugar transporter [Penicillium malachiteum]|uniref:sugar transporter n=1 Tax=Penicillium malachiteum TaxID=1324776 RepID=UPI002549A889|nr:sugar transporter [Penicillium malachiteum]KAJ5735305.1 sugar transporter [Penicillium malachiteum]
MLSNFCNVHSLQVFLIVGPAFILYGYNQSGLSSLLTLPDMLKYLPQVGSSTIKGVVNATLQLGALVGALSCSKLGDILGRRRTIFIAGILTTIGHILQCTSFSLAQFAVGRVILGFGIGQLSVTGPVWQSECSFSDKRGRRVIAAGIYICVGFALATLPTLFSLMITFSIFTLPESPRWLIQMGHIEEASKTLAWLNDLTVDDPSIQLEVARIESAIEAAPKAPLKDLFSKQDEASIIIQFMQQLVGGNVIATYTKTIFETNLQLKGDLPAILAACSRYASTSYGASIAAAIAMFLPNGFLVVVYATWSS